MNEPRLTELSAVRKKLLSRRHKGFSKHRRVHLVIIGVTGYEGTSGKDVIHGDYLWSGTARQLAQGLEKHRGVSAESSGEASDHR